MLEWLTCQFGKARLMLMENLGRQFIVWDKAADIDFITPGKGPVFARCNIDETLLDEIRRQTANGEKYLPRLQVDIHDGAGTLVARVEKPFTCGSSRQRDRHKAWTCAQIC